MSASGNGTDQPVFPIRTVSALTGVAAGTLRAWERRYGFIRPERTPSGHRLYSRRDVERIQQAAELIQNGIAPARIGDLLTDGPPSAFLPDDFADQRRFRRDILRSLDAFDRVDLERALRRGLLDCDLDVVGNAFINPLLRDLQLRWSLDHYMAEQKLLEGALRNLMASCGPDTSSEDSILATTLPGDGSETGLLILAIIGYRKGLSLTVLGPGTPLSELPAIRKRADSPAILLFADSVPDASTIRDQIARLAAEVSCPVYIAGSAVTPSVSGFRTAGTTPLPEDPVAGLQTICSFLRRDH